MEWEPPVVKWENSLYSVILINKEEVRKLSVESLRKVGILMG